MGIFGLGCGFAQSEYAVPFSVSVKSLKRPTALDDITIYILRGFQGLGPAAAVPASVGIALARVRPRKADTVSSLVSSPKHSPHQLAGLSPSPRFLLVLPSGRH